jgi:lipoprotein-anchoring transpeptidase ErfK/SrfK
MGVPGSMGCIRMRNTDVIELFDAVSPGTAVVIA